MRAERVVKARSAVSPILWRKIHKWVGLVIGLQFVLWTVSGAIMALLDMDKVGGHSAAEPVQATTPWPNGLMNPESFGTVESLTLRRLADRPVYEVHGKDGIRLFDAQNGQPVRIDSGAAESVARQSFHHASKVSSVELLERANLEAREHEGPMWRVNFSDEENSSAYVSAVTGRREFNWVLGRKVLR